MGTCSAVVFTFFMVFQMTLALQLRCLLIAVQDLESKIHSCCNENHIDISTLHKILQDTTPREHRCYLACVMDDMTLMEGDNVAIDSIKMMVEIIPFKAIKNIAVEVVKRCESSGKKKDRCESAHYFLVCIKNEFIAFLVNMFTS